MAVIDWPDDARARPGTAGHPPRRRVWLLALATGLVTSSFSTLVIVLASGRIGRNVPLSFMEVGTVLLRWSGVRVQPTWREVLAGLAVHQGADIAWAVTFFGLAGRWTLRLRPAGLLAVAPVWAAATSAAEYYLILPWLQPLLIMQTPYWIALLVHVSSALAYTVSFWLRAPLLGDRTQVRFGRRAAAVLAVILLVLAGLAALGGARREPALPWVDRQPSAVDASFMRKMAAHHQVGVELAVLAAQRGERAELRMLGRLMAAEQTAEIQTLRNWWQSWAKGALPQPTGAEHHAIPGMPPSDVVEELASLTGVVFRGRFLPLMIAHHQGAVRMCQEAWRDATDPRLRLFASQVQHAQEGQLQRLHSLSDRQG